MPRLIFSDIIEEGKHFDKCPNHHSYDSEPYTSKNVEWTSWFENNKATWLPIGEYECPYCWYGYVQSIYEAQRKGIQSKRFEDKQKMEEAKLKEIELKAEIAKLKLLTKK